MLKHLSITNYALIQELDIDLHEGFSVITGETGAGKSILLGAIGLLLGQRADTKALRTGTQKCTIEAVFDLGGYHLEPLFEEMDIDFDGQECIIRRELTSAGKSRAFINDTPATVGQLRQLGEQLIDIHSQHQNLLLSQEEYQLGVLDTLAQDAEQLQAYKVAYRTYKELLHRLEESRRDIDRNHNELEFLTYQYNQLQEANLEEGEDEQLEEEQRTMEHAEDIKGALCDASELLDGDSGGVLASLKQCLSRLQSITGYLSDAEELASRTESCYIELKDICQEVERESEEVDFDPRRMAYVDERLSTIYDLERKHHRESVAELLALQHELKRKLDGITNAGENLSQLEEEVNGAKLRVLELAKDLSTCRRDAAKQLQEEMVRSLIPLGIPNIRFCIELTPTAEPGTEGMDEVEFLFSANKNGSLQRISEVASGGEIARVMLSLKALICKAKRLPTIIFDEIDTGVSGQIAERMALIMREMGTQNRMQVISITHLPQIAALGTHHYRVYKEDNEQETNSHIVELHPQERIEEIAHMLSGADLSQAAIENARTLLQGKTK